MIALPIILFLLIFTSVTNYGRMRYAVSKFLLGTVGKIPMKRLDDKKIIQKYKEKTGIAFDIRIIESKHISGAMPGIPMKPVMLLSSTAIAELSEDELDWIICHEAGHCVKWHTVQTIIIWFTVCFFGIYAISFFQLGTLTSISFAILVSTVFFQMERYFSEYQADLYALQKVDSLDGMIRANRKMKAMAQSLLYKNNVLNFLFTQHLSYDQRIRMAERAKTKRAVTMK